MDCRSLVEWCFEFDVAGAVPVPRAVIDGLMDEACEWADPRGLGIGGGYRPASPEVSGAATRWLFRFGLCVQTDGQLIAEGHAAHLRAVLYRWCRSRGLSFVGGFQPFAPAE